MSYIVHIKPGNYTLYVDDGESVLDAALRQEFIFPYSCQSAICGTCGGTILKGHVEYYDPDAVELTEDEVEEGLALFCSAMPKSDLIIEVDGVFPPSEFPAVTLPYIVTRQEDLSHKMLKLILNPEGDNHLHYRAGQYVNVINSQGQKQPYSIANAPTGGHHIELHLRHTKENAFTNILLDDIKRDNVINIEGPFGKTTFHPNPDRPIIMVAGGSGFVQMKSLFTQSLNLENTLPIHLFWTVRKPNDFYSPLPQQWAETYEHFRFTPLISQPADDWPGEVSRVYEVIANEYPDLSNYQIYASGPAEMVLETLQHLQSQGLQKEFMHSDALSL